MVSLLSCNANIMLVFLLLTDGAEELTQSDYGGSKQFSINKKETCVTAINLHQMNKYCSSYDLLSVDVYLHVSPLWLQN